MLADKMMLEALEHGGNSLWLVACIGLPTACILPSAG